MTGLTLQTWPLQFGLELHPLDSVPVRGSASYLPQPGCITEDAYCFRDHRGQILTVFSQMKSEALDKTVGKWRTG